MQSREEIQTGQANSVAEHFVARRDFFDRLHDCGQLGAEISNARDVIVTHVDLRNDDVDDFWHIDGASGGIKFGHSTDCAIRYSTVADNASNGIWVDSVSDAIVIEGNDVSGSFNNGVLELSLPKKKAAPGSRRVVIE